LSNIAVTAAHAVHTTTHQSQISHRSELQMLPDISLIEEALRGHLGIKYGKLTLKEFAVTTTHKYPQGQIIRKTTITEIVRDGQVIKSYVKKGLVNVI
jgi:hypothetical protein